MTPVAAEQLSPDAFKRLSKFVYDRTGIFLGEEKISLLSNRLRKRVRALGLAGFEDYYRLLRSEAGDAEMTEFLNVVTTNETYFFRNEKLWEFVSGEMLPSLVADKRAARDRSLAFWSAASSTGAEAYTLAIVLRDKLVPLSDWDITIVGSDISEKVLGHARSGRYDAYAISKLTPAKTRACFEHDRAKGTYQLREEYRSLVRFEFHNLRDPYPRGKFDVVFVRNVMMYFDLPMKRRVLANVTAALRPGGYMIIGDVDPLRDGSGLRDDCALDYVRPSVYRKPKP